MRALFQNKKGQDSGDAHYIGRKIFFYIFLLIIVGVLMLFFVTFIDKASLARTTISEGARADFALARITNVCFTVTNPLTGQPQQNILDYSLITSQRLNDCFLSTYPPVMTVKVKPIEHDAFPIAITHIKNGGYSEHEYVRYTLVRYNGKLIPSQIYITI